MSNKIVGLVTFVTGAAIGSLATWRILKERYEKLAEEDSRSIREAFARRELAIQNQNTEPVKTETDKVLEKFGYGSEHIPKEEENEEKGGPVAMDKPYVIDPFDSGNGGEYEIYSLTYYADGVLVDDAGELIEDIDATVGIESLSHFGEYEDDSVFVRDDDLRVDYEILRDYRRYSEVVKTSPPQMD